VLESEHGWAWPAGRIPELTELCRTDS